jgi:RNA polymerase sigma-70 factor, ECF subfamily
VSADQLYRDQYGSILAALIRVLRDVQLAEDVLQDAFAAAVEQWRSGEPANPGAWVLMTARYKAIDRLRRQTVEAGLTPILQELEADRSDAPAPEDPLRLLFTCCHPALAPEAQIALTLRTLCGLSTEEIARAFLVPPTTMAQRIVRAKAKIREARVPYEVPADDALEQRLDPVMAAIYLVFNEGYSATFGDALVRRDLCGQAIRLGHLLVNLLPKQIETRGLLAMMLLHDSRRDTRVDEHGVLVRLENQDRARWDHAQIAEGVAHVEEALRAGYPPGPYVLQAAIAALHAQAPRASDTDWPQIAALYALLYRVAPTPVVELNRAVAIAMADGPERGLALIDQLEARGELPGYHLVATARADLLRRLGRRSEAVAVYRHALELATNDAERRYLEQRLGDEIAGD